MVTDDVVVTCYHAMTHNIKNHKFYKSITKLPSEHCDPVTFTSPKCHFAHGNIQRKGLQSDPSSLLHFPPYVW